MRTDGFSRSLAFGVIVAAAFIPWMLFARPALGGRAALSLYGIGAVAAYVGGLASLPPRRAFAAALACLAGLVVATVARSTGELAIGLATILAIGRSVFLHRLAPARAVAVEALVTGGGLLFARWLAGPSPLETIVAIWAFFLVQSVYFLIGGVRVRTVTAPRRDPFDEAHGRAVALLERGFR